MSTPENPRQGNKRDRDRYIGEVNQAMRHQVAWSEMSDLFRGKLLSALWLSNHGVDDAIEFCDELCDEFREIIAAMAGTLCNTARRLERDYRFVRPIERPDHNGHG